MADGGLAEYAAIATILGGATTAYTALTAKGPQKPDTPEVTAPTVMPIPDDDAAKRAKMRQGAALQQRKGRQSTILSDNTNSDLLGG